MSKKQVVETTINGEPVEFLCEPRQSMLETLRDVLGLTGSKEGCLTGDCGACTILVNDRPVCSCLMLGTEAQGKTITTIEGLAEGNKLHPLQQKFLEDASLQCGICTPGFLMSAKSLLDRQQEPKRSGNPLRAGPEISAAAPVIDKIVHASSGRTAKVLQGANHGRARDATIQGYRHPSGAPRWSGQGHRARQVRS